MRTRNIYRQIENTNNNRGMALLTTLLVITVLVVLGMGFMTLCVSNATQTASVDQFERAYYAAEGGAQQGIEYLKRETLDYYNNLGAKRLISEAGYNSAKSVFFSTTDANSIYVKANSFRPVIDDEYNVTTSVTMSAGSTSDSRLFTVTSTAIIGNVQRKAQASVVINFLDVEYLAAQSQLNAFDDPEAMLVGGTLNLSDSKSSTMVTINGLPFSRAASFGGLIDPSPSQVDINGFFTSLHIDGSSNPKETYDRLNWYLKYSMMYNDAEKDKQAALLAKPYSLLDTANANAPTLVPAGAVVTPTSVTVAGTPVPNILLNILDYPINVNQPRKIYLVSNRTIPSVKASYTVKDFYPNPNNFTEGIIYCDGDLVLDHCLLKNMFIHCTGDLLLSNTQLQSSTVFCDGSIRVDNPADTGYTSFWNYLLNYLSDWYKYPNFIYSKYDLTFTQNFSRNSVYGYFFAGRDFYYISGDTLDRAPSLVYAKRNMHLSSTGSTVNYNGILYTYADMDCEGPTYINGRLAVRGSATVGINKTAAMAGIDADLTVNRGISGWLNDFINGASPQFNASQFDQAVYVSPDDPQVVIPESDDIFSQETTVTGK